MNIIFPNLAKFVLLSFFLFNSCKKSEERSCFKPKGRIIQELRSGKDFNFIFLHDNINLIITQDTFNSIMVECPENLINFIKTDIEGNNLRIKNDNKCDFLRSYKYEINVYVSLVTLTNIYFTGSGNISSTNIIKSGKIRFDFWSASGNLDIDLEAGEATCNLHAGPGDFTIRGSAGVSAVYSLGNGFFHLENFKSGYSFVNQSGTGDFFINAEKELNVEIHSLGSVYYTGNPALIRTTIEGKGQLLKL